MDTRAELFLKSINQKDDIFIENYYLQYRDGDIDSFLNKYKFTHLLILKGDRLYDNDSYENYTKVFESENARIYVRDKQ